MKTYLIKYLSVLFILFVVISCSNDDNNASDKNSTENPTEETSTTDNPTTEVSITDEILKLVNEYRAGKGLKALKKNETAEQLAIDHTRYMISKGEINHDNFDAKFDTLKEKENATGLAENVASFYPDAKSVVAGWIESDGHRKNIEGNFSFTGIAALKDQNGNYYYTQLFYR